MVEFLKINIEQENLWGAGDVLYLHMCFEYVFACWEIIKLHVFMYFSESVLHCNTKFIVDWGFYGYLWQ